jgi:antitoxin PrlF
MNLVKKSRVSSKGQVTIPIEVRKALKLREGDTVRFEVEGDQVTVTLDAPEDPFAAWAGALRDGEGKTIEEIVAELREERGW